MPYKDKATARAKAAERMKKMRGRKVTPKEKSKATGVTEEQGVTEKGVTKVLTDVTPKLDLRGRGMIYVGDSRPCRRCGVEFGHWSGYCDQPEKLVDCISKIPFDPSLIPGVFRGMPPVGPVKKPPPEPSIIPNVVRYVKGQRYAPGTQVAVYNRETRQTEIKTAPEAE